MKMLLPVCKLSLGIVFLVLLGIKIFLYTFLETQVDIPVFSSYVKLISLIILSMLGTMVRGFLKLFLYF